MKLSVIGCGYLGAVHAAAMARLGHTVVGVENDERRYEALSKGEVPFYEPGLPEMITAEIEAGRLTFTRDIADATDAEVHFVCVGTPQTPGRHAADMTYVNGAIDGLLPVLRPGAVVVGKSTVPVGTAAGIAERLDEHGTDVSLVWNPEFLREGFAVQDTLEPDRIVMGVGPGERGQQAGKVLQEVYADILDTGTPLVVTDFPTAELVKTAANAFLATKISFINAMAELCETTGGDVTKLSEALGHDARIGRRFLNSGIGFGGGCLPKDIRAFMARAGELGADQALTFLREVDAINLRRRDAAVGVVMAWLGGRVVGKRIAVLGAAFKPDSDDIRDSPALSIAEALHVRGADVVLHDPKALANARRKSPQLGYADTVEQAAHGADAVLVLTEWQQFRDLDPAVLGEIVAGKRVFDGRHALDPDRWRAAGWEYKTLGRPHA
ncbi:MAG: UDP-glucose/GDP-mannose dehydrogenase family protein [Nocardioidaceae bacterium]|nr:UDP-glucose/GDP-mannose dehydrogenase family protein [Nocardioidaceae bacterium]